MMGATVIDLYTAVTPNGYKVSIMLEECGLAYTPHYPDLSKLEHRQPKFLALNPNGRVPVIIDHDAGGFPVFESGAILVYLGQKTGRFFPSDPKRNSSMMQWLMWQMAGLGPMMAQLNVFIHLFPERLPQVVARYRRESYRLFGVMESQLAKRQYLACDEYTIADIASWCWILSKDWSQLSLDDYPAIRRWSDEIASRPAVAAGLRVPPLPTSDDNYEERIARVRKTLA